MFIIALSILCGVLLQGLSRNRDGLLFTEVDLNLCRQIKDYWGFRVSGLSYTLTMNFFLLAMNSAQKAKSY